MGVKFGNSGHIGYEVNLLFRVYTYGASASRPVFFGYFVTSTEFSVITVFVADQPFNYDLRERSYGGDSVFPPFPPVGVTFKSKGSSDLSNTFPEATIGSIQYFG